MCEGKDGCTPHRLTESKTHERTPIAPVHRSIDLPNTHKPPTNRQIDALQQQYIQALTALYDRHKVEHGGRRPDAVLDVR